MWRPVGAAIVATLSGSSGIASAQTAATETRYDFVLARSPARPASVAAPRRDDLFRYRALPRRERITDRAHDIGVAVDRRTSRFGARPVTKWTFADWRANAAAPSYDLRSRSRVTALHVGDRFAIGDRATATLGWRGVKVSNRNANVTLDGGDDRLSAHDWFLPEAALAYRPAADLTLSLGYKETMRGYEGTGSTGPLGLGRPAFDALRASLRPERTRQMRLGGRWMHDDIAVSIGGYRATVRDAVSFADRSYVPVNVGSASLSGMAAVAEQRLTSHLSWSLHYRHAIGTTDAGDRLREIERGVGGAWTSGRWRGSIEASRVSGASLQPLASSPRDAMRAEIGIAYAASGPDGQRLNLSLRLIDPSRFASSRVVAEPGVVRAEDRSRAVMFAAGTSW